MITGIIHPFKCFTCCEINVLKYCSRLAMQRLALFSKTDCDQLGYGLTHVFQKSVLLTIFILMSVKMILPCLVCCILFYMRNTKNILCSLSEAYFVESYLIIRWGQLERSDTDHAIEQIPSDGSYRVGFITIMIRGGRKQVNYKCSSY